MVPPDTVEEVLSVDKVEVVSDELVDERVAMLEVNEWLVLVPVDLVLLKATYAPTPATTTMITTIIATRATAIPCLPLVVRFFLNSHSTENVPF